MKTFFEPFFSNATISGLNLSSFDLPGPLGLPSHFPDALTAASPSFVLADIVAIIDSKKVGMLAWTRKLKK